MGPVRPPAEWLLHCGTTSAHVSSSTIPPSAKHVVSNAVCFSSALVFMKPKGTKPARNHHQPHQVLPVLEIRICQSKLTLLQAFKDMRREENFLSTYRLVDVKPQSPVQLMPHWLAYLECNTLLPNNRCWEPTFVFSRLLRTTSHAFWGLKKERSYFVSTWNFCCGFSGRPPLLPPSVSISCLLIKIHIQGQKSTSLLPTVRDTQK